jgi:predicted glycoside hydrolase/deacetylase ChbG (UPF0249 family)
MQRRLIVNADGFGFTKGINKGIIESIENGVVSSISCNVNFPYIKDVEYIASRYPKISIGLHINVNVGKPVCSPEEIPSLINASGEFWGSEFTRRFVGRKIKVSDIQKECEAQILKLQGLGVKISHLDGHQNKHLYPGYFGTVLSLGKKYGINRIRCHRRYIFLKNGNNRTSKIFGYYLTHPRQIVSHGYNLFMMGIAENKGFTMADRMISHGYVDESEKYSLDAWIEIIRSLPPGINEIYCHPGYPDAELRKYATYVDGRPLETAVLTSRELSQNIEKEHVEIISFNEI